MAAVPLLTRWNVALFFFTYKIVIYSASVFKININMLMLHINTSKRQTSHAPHHINILLYIWIHSTSVQQSIYDGINCKYTKMLEYRERLESLCDTSVLLLRVYIECVWMSLHLDGRRWLENSTWEKSRHFLESRLNSSSLLK